MGYFNFLFLAIGFVLLGIVVVVLSLRWLRRDEVSSRLQQYVGEQNPRPRREWAPALAVRQQELSGNLLTRLFLPLLRRTGELMSRVSPQASIDSVRHQLSIAGNPYRMGPREYHGMRLVFILAGLWLAYVFIRRDTTPMNLTISIASIAIMFLLPPVWLRRMVNSRQEKIRRSLPDALDMLSVCADAGLGFDQSLQRVSEQWRTPIAIELGRVVSEMEMGLSRKEALRNLANRLDVSELSSFVAVIIQSDQLGMSISDTLHSQAEQMRIERRYRAQEIARTIPTKMLIPLAFFIFPAIMAVVLGPSIPSLLDLFGGL